MASPSQMPALPAATGLMTGHMPGQSLVQADHVRYAVYVRLPFARGDFVNPPLIDWPVQRDQQLWDILSQAPRGQPPDWHQLAAHFDVPLAFLLQQAAWLYEQQLVQVRAQMRQVAIPAPAFPQPEKEAFPRPEREAFPQPEREAFPQPEKEPEKKSRPTMAMRHPSTSTVTQSRHGAKSARSQLRKAPTVEKSNEAIIDNLASDSSSSESDDVPVRSRMFGWDAQRRNASRKEVYGDEERGDDDDAPAFLPFAGTATANPGQGKQLTARQDKQSTARQGKQLTAAQGKQLTAAQGKQLTAAQGKQLTARKETGEARKETGEERTKATLSIGSSFSDLDEASVTQSAMEEYIMSRMQHPQAQVVASSSTDDSSGFSRAFRSPR